MKTIKLTEVLDYYDGIEVFAAQDIGGSPYIALAIDPVDGLGRYVVTGAVPERLQQFRSGGLDLRTLLLEAPGGEWYITVADGTIDDPLALEPQGGLLAEREEFLPEPGFVLDGFQEDGRDGRQAGELSNGVLALSADHPAAQGHPAD